MPKRIYKHIYTGLIITAVLFFVGCGSKMHTIKVDSMPSGAKVVLDGKSQSDTPSDITVKKDDKTHYLFIHKDGCEEYSTILKNNKYPKQLSAKLDCPPPTQDPSDADDPSQSDLNEDKLGEGQGGWASPRDRFENEDIRFSYDSSALSPDAREVLGFKAEWLRDNPQTQVIIEGHTDERGTVEYNLALGERRAQSARDFLKTMGISDSRMLTISYGEELPLDSGQSESNYAANRRAHFVIK